MKNAVYIRRRCTVFRTLLGATRSVFAEPYDFSKARDKANNNYISPKLDSLRDFSFRLVWFTLLIIVLKKQILAVFI